MFFGSPPTFAVGSPPEPLCLSSAYVLLVMMGVLRGKRVAILRKVCIDCMAVMDEWSVAKVLYSPVLEQKTRNVA